MGRPAKSSLKALAPFSAAAVLAWSVMLLGSRTDWTQYAASGALALLAGVLAVAATSGRPRVPFEVVPGALVFLAAVALLRNSVGGTNSGAGALAMVPVFHAALHSRSRAHLAVVVAGVGVFYLAPIVLIGAPAYPTTQYRTVVLSVAVSTIVGYATQQLVASVRRQASQARSRERMLERLTDIVHGLFESRRPRADVCEAARSVSGAEVALLYEPGPGGELCCTATAGFDGPTERAVALPRSAVREAFRSGRPELACEDVETRVGSVDLWVAAGRPRAVLFQPLQRQGVSLGVLVVAWAEIAPAGDPRMTVATLLAHEAAAVIARADVLDSLVGEAQTDPLTGLPNRRAWDAALERASRQGAQLAIAMFDLDHFKEFNDANGHPAGDRLLKETAAAWREQLRNGDLLARLGGEEFGLMLRDCDAETALEVTERLRSRVSNGRTCSAGIAFGGAGEDIEEIVGRADRALYRAKSTGRDRTQVIAAL